MAGAPALSSACGVCHWLRGAAGAQRLAAATLSPWGTGLTDPPPWPTTQDPWGLGLIFVLVLKEVPFLLWAALAHLQRPDVARRLRQELTLAHTLGYSEREAWWRVGWPQLLPRLAVPLLGVWAYGLTVVDVALVIGPDHASHAGHAGLAMAAGCRPHCLTRKVPLRPGVWRWYWRLVQWCSGACGD